VKALLELFATGELGSAKGKDVDLWEDLVGKTADSGENDITTGSHPPWRNCIDLNATMGLH
jgi:hypothetical protein